MLLKIARSIDICKNGCKNQFSDDFGARVACQIGCEAFFRNAQLLATSIYVSTVASCWGIYHLTIQTVCQKCKKDVTCCSP